MSQVTVNEAQPGWYQVDLSTMTAGSGTMTVKQDNMVLVTLSGGGVRKTHGEKLFMASANEMTIELPGRTIIHGPFDVTSPVSGTQVLSKTWVVSSEDGGDNDYNDYTTRLTWFRSAG